MTSNQFDAAPGMAGADARPGLGQGAGVLARLAAHPRVAAVLRLLPALVPALLFLPVVLSPPLNHDVAAVLEFAQRWLAGAHLYTDLIDVNPPLIFVLNLIPAWIDAVTPLDGAQSLQLCVLGFGGFGWWLAIRVRDRAAEGAVQRAVLDVLPALFLLAAGYDFGQREHLMALGALPYLLCSVERISSGRVSGGRIAGRRPRGHIAVALTAGIGFALKPHFLAIPALIELAVFIGRAPRGPVAGAFLPAVATWARDPVPWFMTAVWAVYLVSLRLVFPDYLGTVVPLVRDYYLALGDTTMGEVLLIPRMATTLCLLLPLLWLAFRAEPRARPRRETALPRLFGLAALGALASAVAQHKGWSYHILPIELFCCAMGLLLAARWLDGLGAGGLGAGGVGEAAAPRVAAVLTSLFALYAVATGEAPWKELDYGGSQARQLTAKLRQEAAGEGVLVLSPGIYPIYPALNDAGARNTLRTMNTWLLEGAYRTCLPDGQRYRQVWQMGRPEFFVYRTVAEDFARAPPAAVLVDKQPGIPWCGSEFDFIAYFKRHPLFAEVWSHYQLAAEWDRYRLYTRKD